MGRYKRYKKDSTIEAAVLRRYGLGGLLQKTGQGFANYGKLIADTGLTGIGMSNVIDDDSYKGFGANAANKFMDIQERITPIKNKIGATVANTVAPGTGALLNAGLQTAEQFNPQEELMSEQYIKGNSPIRTARYGGDIYKCGGKMKRYQDGGLTEFNGLTHEQGGLPITNDIEVEDGETRKGDFIFSDNIRYSKDKTFADMSKHINKKYSLRPKDKYSKESMDRELESLASQQESIKGLEDNGFGIEYKKGGIMIKPSKRGTFKAQATKMGMGVQEVASKILSAEEDRYSPEMRKKANFAKNFARNGGLINPNTGRLKLEDGIPTWEELQIQGFISSSNPPPGEGWKQYTMTVKGAPSNVKIWYREKASDANDAFVYAKKQGVNKGDTFEYKGKKYVYKFAETPKELKALEEATKKEFAYNYEQNPDTINDIEDIMPGEFPPEPVEPMDYSYEVPPATPLKTNWGRIGLGMVPGIAAGIGNLALGNTIDYPRVAPDQVRLQNLDPTRASQEIRGVSSGATEGIRQNARGIGSYLSNRLGVLGQEQRGLSDVYSRYDNANTEINNRERLTNVDLREKAKYTNFNTDIMERDARFNAKSAALQNFADATAKGIEGYDRQDFLKFTAATAAPNYTIGKEDGNYFRQYTNPYNIGINSTQDDYQLEDVNNIPTMFKNGGYLNKYKNGGDYPPTKDGYDFTQEQQYNQPSYSPAMSQQDIMMQKQQQIEDLEGLNEWDFRDRYRMSRHRFRRNIDPNYRLESDIGAGELKKKYGEVDYPSTDMRSQNFEGNPNLGFMSPQQTNPQLARSVQDYNLDVIGLATPIPGLGAAKTGKYFKSLPKALSPKEASIARAERLLAQSDKFADDVIAQGNKEVLAGLSQGKNFEQGLAKDYGKTPVNLGVNQGGKKAVLFDDAVNKNTGKPLTDIERQLIASHETGHSYRNSPGEATEWLEAFEQKNLSNYLRGKPIRSKGFPGETLARGHAEELRERAGQLKDFIAMKKGIPLNQDFRITMKDLNHAINNYRKEIGLDNDMSQFFSAIKDKKKLLNVMNKYALGSTGIYGASQLNNE